MTLHTSWTRGWLCVALAGAFIIGGAQRSSAQLTTRVTILQAEDRRAPSAQDLATLRAGARSGDAQTARIGLRALGRLERPRLHSRHSSRVAPSPIRSAGRSRQRHRPGGAGLPHGCHRPNSAISSAETALISRLGIEADSGVRAALCEAIGRLPYSTTADAARAESALMDFAAKAGTNTDRLGLAKGLEAFARLQRESSARAIG